MIVIADSEYNPLPALIDFNSRDSFTEAEYKSVALHLKLAGVLTDTEDDLLDVLLSMQQSLGESVPLNPAINYIKEKINVNKK